MDTCDAIDELTKRVRTSPLKIHPLEVVEVSRPIRAARRTTQENGDDPDISHRKLAQEGPDLHSLNISRATATSEYRRGLNRVDQLLDFFEPDISWPEILGVEPRPDLVFEEPMVDRIDVISVDAMVAKEDVELADSLLAPDNQRADLAIPLAICCNIHCGHIAAKRLDLSKRCDERN